MVCIPANHPSLGLNTNSKPDDLVYPNSKPVHYP